MERIVQKDCASVALVQISSAIKSKRQSFDCLLLANNPNFDTNFGFSHQAISGIIKSAKTNAINTVPTNAPIPISSLVSNDFAFFIRNSEVTEPMPPKAPPIAPPTTGKIEQRAMLLPQVSKKISGRKAKTISYHFGFGETSIISLSI